MPFIQNVCIACLIHINIIFCHVFYGPDTHQITSSIYWIRAGIVNAPLYDSWIALHGLSYFSRNQNTTGYTHIQGI